MSTPERVMVHGIAASRLPAPFELPIQSTPEVMSSRSFPDVSKIESFAGFHFKRWKERVFSALDVLNYAVFRIATELVEGSTNYDKTHVAWLKGNKVEELAFLIKDNLSCKHLILSVEEALVDFLENDMSPDGILELEPMSPYNRLLLHRLADIFGLAHESVGEGDDRHLILERCPESSIPSVLVSDILWQCNEYQSPATTHQLLRRKDALPPAKENPKSLGTTLEEREAAYLAARERIFSVESGEVKESCPPKPRNVPVVARRMIAHALGQRINSNLSSVKVNLSNSEENGEERIEELSTKEKNETHPYGSSRVLQETSISSQKIGSSERIRAGRKVSNASSSTSQGERKGQKKLPSNRTSNDGAVQTGSSGKDVSKDNLKQEHLGAAKRIFAHALGLQAHQRSFGEIP